MTGSPQRIDADLIGEALNAFSETASADDPTFDELGRAGIKELVRRFEESPGELPGTFLMKMVTDYFKAVREDQRQHPEKTGEEPDLLAVIDQEGYPIGRKRDRLRAEIVVLRERLGLYEKRLGELDGN